MTFYLQSAPDALKDEIPVAMISDTGANREAVASGHLDPGEAQQRCWHGAVELIMRAQSWWDF